MVISNHVTDELTRYFSREHILEIPILHFGGFHSDVIYFAKQAQHEQPQFYLNNPTVSAIGLWGAVNGLPVRDTQALFLSAEVFVFTLGLTETWIRRSDGAVLPIAPGVVAGRLMNRCITLKTIVIKRSTPVWLNYSIS